MYKVFFLIIDPSDWSLSRSNSHSLTNENLFSPLVIMMVLLAHPFKSLDTYSVQTLVTQVTTKADCLTCALTFHVFSSLGRAETRDTQVVWTWLNATPMQQCTCLVYTSAALRSSSLPSYAAPQVRSWKKAQETVLNLWMSSWSFDVTTPITLHTFEMDVFVSWNSWFSEVEVVYFRNTRPSIITMFYQNQWTWDIKLLNRF